MPYRQVYYPNRTKIRHFTEKDVARIAKYAVRDGANPVKVLAAIAASLGLGASICVTAKSIRSALSLTAFLKKLGASMAVGQLIKVLIQIFMGAKLKAPPNLNLILAITIAALVVIDSVLDSIAVLITNRDDMLGVTVFLDDLCKHIREISNDVIDDVVDSNAFGVASKSIDDAAFAFKTETEQAWQILIEETWWNRFLAIFN